jgi:Ca-activated chloride channel family protein
VIFSGIPSFVGGEAVLFDSSRDEDAGRIAESATIRLIEVRFPDGEPERSALDPGLALVVFVGDLASPRARMALVDLLRRRGQRPLNISKAKGDVVRVVLVDPQGAWKDGAPKIEVALAW